MSQKIQEMYQRDIIDKYDRDTYMLYEANESGREYLKNKLEQIALEDPTHMQFKGSFEWVDGRRSVWRDIVIQIGIIKLKLEEYLNDERTRYDSDPNRYNIDNSL